MEWVCVGEAESRLVSQLLVAGIHQSFFLHFQRRPGKLSSLESPGTFCRGLAKLASPSHHHGFDRVFVLSSWCQGTWKDRSLEMKPKVMNSLAQAVNGP
jgi:hypothetical protein